MRYECFIGGLDEGGIADWTRESVEFDTLQHARRFMLDQIVPYIDENGGTPSVQHDARRTAVDLILVNDLDWVWTAEIEGDTYQMRRLL